MAICLFDIVVYIQLVVAPLFGVKGNLACSAN
jgi:hypothetical protein